MTATTTTTSSSSSTHTTSTTHAASSSTVHGAAKTAARSAGEASTMRTAAEAGLAAEGVLICHAAVVESTECARALARFHVRRGEPAISSMVDRSASTGRDATRKTMRPSASKTGATV